MDFLMLVMNLLIVYFPVMLLGFFTPDFMKKTLFFGISIPEETRETAEILKIEKNYKRCFILSGIGTIIFIHLFVMKVNNMNISNFGVLLLILMMTINYLIAHRKVKALKQAENWTADKKQMVIVDISRHHKQNKLPFYWFCIPVGVLLYTVMITLIKYPNLPEKIPTHFDLYGNITTYTDKSPLSVGGLILTQILMTALMYILYGIVQRAKPSIDPSKPKTSIKQNQMANRYWAIYILCISTAINLQFAYVQSNILQITDSKMWIGSIIHGLAIVIPIGGALFVAAKVGQSGNRIKVDEKEEGNQGVISRDDDRYWKFGMFYYNPEDPSLHVEKRFGIGWTINLGNPIGKIIVIGLILFIAIRLISSYL